MLEDATQDTETLIKIVPDFQVSNVNIPYDPSITDLANGEFLITWTAYNPELTNSEIYGLRYNENGTPVGQVFRVNTSTRNQENSSSATTLTNGSFVVTWTSSTLDGYQSKIYGQRFNASGTKIGREFRVNTQTEGQQEGATVKALTNGGFVVIWNRTDTDGSEENVYGQRYDANGNKIGQEFRVHEYPDGTQYLESVAALADGGFIVSWSSYNQYSVRRYNTYVQRFSASGAKVGQEFLIDPDFRALNATVTSLADGRYIIAWSSYIDNNILRGHYGQLYNLDGSKRGELFQLDLGTAITALTNGEFVVTGEVYNAQDGTSRDLYSQQYDANAQPVGQTLRINTVRKLDQEQVKITPLTNGGFAATWESTQDGTYNIYGTIFNQGETGSIALEETSYRIEEDGTSNTAVTLIRTGGSDGDVEVTLMLNDGTATAPYNYDNTPIAVAFAPGETRKTVIVPIVNDDRLEADETINLSVLDLTGTTSTQATLTIIDNDENHLSQKPAIRVGSELQINTMEDGNSPLVTTLADGGFLVTWNTEFNYPSGGSVIIGIPNNGEGFDGQRYDANGNRVGEEFIISVEGRELAVTDLTDGGFVATWQISVPTPEIYGQRYDASSNPVGQTFPVTGNTDFLNNPTNPQSIFLVNGEFAIIWEEYSDLKGLRFDASNNPVGQPFVIHTEGYRQFYGYNPPAAASLADGGFVVTWTSSLPDDSEAGIYGQRYDAAVNPVGSAFQVNTSTVGNQQNSAIAALPDGGFVVTWESTRQADSDIYSQRYDSLGNPVGQEFRVNTNTAGDQKNASVTSLSNGGFAIAWESGTDVGYGQQYDINSNPVGQEFRINTSFSIENPSISYLSDERFFVAWEDFGSNIYGQIFQPVTGLEMFSFAQLARSGFIDGLTFNPVEVGGLSLASLYDETYYLNQNSDVAAAVRNQVLSNGYKHFVDFGQFEGRNPSTLYNEVLYLAQNPDVAEAVETDLFSSGFQHYALFGHKEGYSPSDLFNEQAYQAANPDVADAITNGGFRSGFEHYIEAGQAEGRSPLNFLYNESDYLIQNPDVANAVNAGFFQDGFEHYINFGQTEKRNPSRMFDESQYLELNSDVANAVNAGTLKSGFEHYILYGRTERRDI